MSALGLEQRYRRVLRLLPGYYRVQWEEDMVAAFLDSWTSGDPDDDEWALEFCKPTWPEVASVAGLTARLYLGGPGSPRRYFTWGQAVRGAVLTVLLVHAVLGLGHRALATPRVVRPFPGKQLEISLTSRNQVQQLYRMLVPAG